MTSPAGVLDRLLGERYRLVELLAVGGMGEVWRGEDVRLGRPVAIKVLRPEHVADPEFRDRFRNEARAAGRLSSPGIASVYDYGEQPDRAWLVMELVDGEPLSQLLRRSGPLPVERVLDLVAQTATALHVAHRAGVVHRDVKPGNLLLRPDGAVKVTDFGIASAADAVPVTRTGSVVGTASYLSPEQVAGQGATAQSDVYALGVVLHELLTGQRPFPDDNPVVVAMAHLRTPPPPLPDTVPPAVRDLARRLLDKDPAGRPAGAAALAAECAALLDAHATGTLPALEVEPPDAARPAGAATRTMSLPRRARRAAAAPSPTRRAARGAVVVLAALALLIGAGTGVRALLDPGSTLVPAVPAGSPLEQAVAQVRAAELQPDQRAEPSADVPAGAVVAVEPAAGTELVPGDVVVLVVSTGPPPVELDPAAWVGKPWEEVRDGLLGLGLEPKPAYDGTGTAVGTVSDVDPAGLVAVGTPVVVRVVPAPPPPPPPAPVRSGSTATSAGSTAPAGDTKSSGADKGADKGKGSDKGKGRR